VIALGTLVKVVKVAESGLPLEEVDGRLLLAAATIPLAKTNAATGTMTAVSDHVALRIVTEK
jgi:hypothetical protein